jgi:PIN domain nuclease of toxin-antitoxin system
MIALDASALLAFLFREAGHQRVRPLLQEACMSTVNLSEVVARFVRDGKDIREILRRLAASPIEWVPFTVEQAVEAAKLAARTDPLGLSLGDRACLALAGLRRIPAVTADRAWRDADLGIEVEVIR